jgi:hypothetical protein
LADIATVVVLTRLVKEETHELVETLLLTFPCDNLVYTLFVEVPNEIIVLFSVIAEPDNVL